MDSAVDIVGNEEEAGVADCVAPQQSADPFVYQLVRVDGDGRLIPATEDEVMAVENLLEDDKSKITTPDTLKICSTSYGRGPCDSDKVQFKASEGVDVCVEKPVISSEPAVGSGEREVCGDNVHQPASSDRCSKLVGGLEKSKSSISAVGTGSEPDFSMLNGEIHLDDLSVKDLQETFKATFGRETSVKDKEWLKRRIIMGLTNSCDFSTTSFVITDNRVVKKGKEEISKSMDCSILVDCVVTSVIGSPSTCHGNENEIHSIADGMEIQSSTSQDNCGSKYTHTTEQRPAKRVRKPTKRYIEQLSEGESRDSSARVVSSVKHAAYDHQLSPKVCAKPVQNFELGLTRKDSLGGSGIKVPYVSRIRRSRPREDFMTLMKFQSGGFLDISTRLEKNDVTSSDGESCSKVLKNSSPPRCTQEPPVDSSEKKITTQMEMDLKPKSVESYKTSSDDDVVTVPTANGGMRRKHHRPWTLSEVVKLVEGVAKYGAGRWSEIKRLAFASYSYRTSVDLKDKWRNLLRASLAENGIHSSRKQASVPIPAQILSRVRELADVQTQVSPSVSSGHIDSST